MAKKEAGKDGPTSSESDELSVDRRSYLKLSGAVATSFAIAGASGTTVADDSGFGVDFGTNFGAGTPDDDDGTVDDGDETEDGETADDEEDPESEDPEDEEETEETEEDSDTDDENNESDDSEDDDETDVETSDPSISKFDVSERGNPNPHAEFEIDWRVVDDDGALDEVKFTVANIDGRERKTKNISISGEDASDLTEMRVKHRMHRSYYVTIEVWDAYDNKHSSTTRLDL